MKLLLVRVVTQELFLNNFDLKTLEEINNKSEKTTPHSYSFYVLSSLIQTRRL